MSLGTRRRIPRPLRSRLLPVGIAILMISLGIAAGLRLPSSRAQAQSEPSAGPCQITATRRVAPLSILPGALTTATLRVAMDCEVQAHPLDMVILVDARPEIERSTLQDLKTGLERVIENVDLSAGAGSRISIMPFDDRGPLDADLQLSGIKSELRSNLRRIERSDRSCAMTQIDCGAAAAYGRATEILRNSRVEGGRQALLLATVGVVDDSSVCADLRERASNLADDRSAEVLRITACASQGTQDCRTRCLEGLASEPEFGLHSPSETWTPLITALPGLFDGSGRFHPLRVLEVEEELPEGLEYAGGDPPLIIERQLLWSFPPIRPREAFTRSYRLRSLACGEIPSSLRSSLIAEYVEPFWRRAGQRLDLDRPGLNVPCEPPTESPTPTTPETPSPSPIASPASPSPIRPSPSPSPPRPTWRAYLPWLANQGCAKPLASPMDLIIAIDVAGSMARPAGPPFAPDLNRWSAARESSLAILDRLESSAQAGHRAALIQFGTAQSLSISEGGLAPCCGAARAALSGDNYQRLDEGLAWEGLAVARRLQALAQQPRPRRDVLLVTDQADGDLRPSHEAALDAEAAALAEAGVALRVLKIGGDERSALLRRLVAPSNRFLPSARLSAPAPPRIADWMLCGP